MAPAAAVGGGAGGVYAKKGTKHAEEDDGALTDLLLVRVIATVDVGVESDGLMFVVVLIALYCIVLCPAVTSSRFEKRRGSQYAYNGHRFYGCPFLSHYD